MTRFPTCERGTRSTERGEIFRSGLPVYEAEEGTFIDEKVHALMLYDDALPFHRMLRERLREDAKRPSEDTHVT